MTTKMIIEAFDLKSKGYYKQAIELLYKVLSIDENNVEVMSELSNLYFLLNNSEKALNYAEKVLEINEHDITALKVICNINFKNENYIDAKKSALSIYNADQTQENLAILLKILNKQSLYDEVLSYKDFAQDESTLYEIAFAMYNKSEDISWYVNKITDTNTNYPEALFLIGLYYFDNKDFNKSEKFLKQFITKNDSNINAFNKLGLISLDKMDLDNALNYFQQALYIDEKSTTTNYNLGQAYFLRGDLQKAKSYFSKVIYLDPQNNDYKYSLAYLHYRLGDINTALAQLPDNHLASEILKLKIKSEQGNNAAAKIGLEKLIITYPDNELLCTSLAQIYYNLEMYKQALNLLIKFTDKNQNNKEALYLLCEIAIKIKDIELSEKYIQEYANLYENSQKSNVLFAKLAYLKNDMENLYDIAQKIIEKNPNCYEGYYFNSLALFEQKDVNFAIESLKKAISLDVNNPELYVKMSEFYQAIGEYKNALAYITEAADIDSSPTNRQLYKKLADIVRTK